MTDKYSDRCCFFQIACFYCLLGLELVQYSLAFSHETFHRLSNLAYYIAYAKLEQHELTCFDKN